MIMYLANATHLVVLRELPSQYNYSYKARGADSGTGSPPGRNFLSKSERERVTEGKLIALNKKRSLLSFQERILTPEMATFLRKLILLNGFSTTIRPMTVASHHQPEMRNDSTDGLAHGNRSRLVFEKCSVRIIAGTSAFLAEVFRDFPRSLQTNLRYVPIMHPNHSTIQSGYWRCCKPPSQNI